MAKRVDRATDGGGLDLPEPDPEGAAAFGPRPTAEYIGAMAGELAAMARGRDFAFLAHLLEMAQLEASAVQAQLGASRQGGRARLASD